MKNTKTTLFPKACDQECPDVVSEVCGSDGSSYGNVCQLELHACQHSEPDLVKVSDGPCKSENQS
jgi:hypothetical protein